MAEDPPPDIPPEARRRRMSQVELMLREAIARPDRRGRVVVGMALLRQLGVYRLVGKHLHASEASKNVAQMFRPSPM